MEILQSPFHSWEAHPEASLRLTARGAPFVLFSPRWKCEDRLEDWHLPTEIGAKFLPKVPKE